VVGERSLDKGEIEYRGRTDSENQMLPLDTFVDFIRDRIAAETGTAAL
jgi:prolyl-tRNA synthetase